MLKKFRLSLLFLLIPAILFAADVPQNMENEDYYQVLAAGETDAGWRIFAEDQEGNLILFNLDSTTEGSVSFDELNEGDVLLIKDNGIRTMSIPPQAFALSYEVVDKTEYTFPPVTDEMAQSIIAEFGQNDGELVLEDVISRFSYGYGYDSMASLMDKGLIVRGDYFSRGILDAFNGRTDILLTVDEILSSVEDYFANVYGQEGYVGDAGTRISQDEINALPAPRTVDEKFAYSYGFMLASQLIYNNMDLEANAFITGLTEALYGDPSRLSTEEKEAAANEYVDLYNEKVMAMIEEMAKTNLAEADAFFSEDGEGSAYERIGSYLLIDRTSETTEGEMPTVEDTVNVNYTLRDLAGNLIDEGQDVSFALTGVIDGFRDAILNMHVGESAIAYVHPAAGYGEMGAGGIEPNKLLVFDITLNGIEDSTSTDTTAESTDTSTQQAEGETL